MAFIQPLDLEVLLLSILAGDPLIFWLVGMIFIFIVAGYFKIPGGATVVLAFVFTIMGITPGRESSTIYMVVFLTVIIVAIIVASSWSKIVNK